MARYIAYAHTGSIRVCIDENGTHKPEHFCATGATAAEAYRLAETAVEATRFPELSRIDVRKLEAV